MSKRIRINNDILVEWTVNLHRSDGTLVDLTSLNLGVQLCVGSKVFEVSDPTIAANLVTFLFPGSQQQYDGPYVAKLYDKDNTTVTYDVRNAFILVDHSWGADSVYTPDDVTVEIETDINAVQIIAIAGPKGDKGDKGDTGSKGDAGENGADGANGYDGVDGKDGADGKDGQDGRNGVDGKDGEPGRSIRKSVFEVGKMYYNGEVLSDDGVYYLDIVTDTAVAMADEEVNYYVCKETHLSTANEDLNDTTLWTPMSEMDPIVTPLVLAKQIDAEFIDVDSLVAKKVTVTDGNNAVIAKIGDMNDYTVGSSTNKFPLWLGGSTPATAVTRFDKDGKLYASGGEFGIVKILTTSDNKQAIGFQNVVYGSTASYTLYITHESITVIENVSGCSTVVSGGGVQCFNSDSLSYKPAFSLGAGGITGNRVGSQMDSLGTYNADKGDNTIICHSTTTGKINLAGCHYGTEGMGFELHVINYNGASITLEETGATFIKIGATNATSTDTCVVTYKAFWVVFGGTGNLEWYIHE